MSSASSSSVRASDPARGYGIALVSAAVFSSTAIFIRYLIQTYRLPPLVLAFWRDAFVVLALWPVLRFLRPRLLRINRPDMYYLAGYGLVLAVYNATWTVSVALNGAAIATVLVYSSAAFTALLGRWFLKEPLSWVKLLAIAFSLGGCILISGTLGLAAWRVNLMGILTGTLSGLCYAVYSLMGRSASQRGLNPWTTLLHTFAFATGFLLLLNLLPQGIWPGTAAGLADFFWLGRALPGWGVLILLAAGPTLVGYGLYNVSLGHLPSSVANLILTIEPVFTAAIAYFLLGERLTGVQVAGSLMILVGVVVLRIGSRWGRSRTAVKATG
jgi:drug/metabolite transporter (DMT)-like permease